MIVKNGSYYLQLSTENAANYAYKSCIVTPKDFNDQMQNIVMSCTLLQTHFTQS